MKLITYIFSFLLILLLSSCTDTLIGDEGQAEEDNFLNYQTKTALELPFENEWYVVWGGRSVVQNQHFNNRNERYAMDILQIVNRTSFTGDGTQNEDYYCFGKRLNAPGDGKIIAMENNIEDNIPGALNRRQAPGNYIIIDHLNGEFSFMAHFKKNSIIVSIGDTIQKGQEVGKVGNSGNSTEPHLHYHLQTTSDSSNGVGLPIQFLNYYEDNVFVEIGEPVRGQLVRKN
ncbi:M23 family metallopeptidase [uncultured Aquimarina sp.]|uniref:M23 family metallopeptidase n=1 Tax=uncultured Aquimarina sp. TaxID=575652 RepID=UPI00261E4903|nr:M23 family metallopeptidase [uncultured Aquimarina sp.]